MPDITHWTLSRKLQVLNNIRDGIITRAQACDIYGLSQREISEWQRIADTRGTPALRVTHSTRYRRREKRENNR